MIDNIFSGVYLRANRWRKSHPFIVILLAVLKFVPVHMILSWLCVFNQSDASLEVVICERTPTQNV